MMPQAIFFAQVQSPAASEWTAGLKRVADALTPITGDWIGRDIGFGITWLQLTACVLAMVATIAVAALLHALIHRKIKHEHNKAEALPKGESASPETEQKHWWHTWFKLMLQAAAPPFMLFVCACGFYAALRLLVVHMQTEGGDAPVITALIWLRKTANFIALFWFLFRLVGVIEIELRTWSKKSSRKWDDVVAAIVSRALRLLVPLVGFLLIVPTLTVNAQYHEFLREGSSILLIAAIGFILYQLVSTMEQAVVDQYRIDMADNLSTRKIQTQVRVLKRVAVVLISIFTVASMLMVFDSVRQLGTSLLASAGIAGIVIGFAAQKSIASILAGIQIAFSQPMRIDDAVIVEGEYGNIEEITMTYVVVRLWDLRRMVLPISYFIEKPFQNWTRTGANLLGTVEFYVDYTIQMAPLRAELDRILTGHPSWDKVAKAFQVTDAKEQTLQIRVLVSAANSGALFDLRCDVREKMIDFLQRNYPDCLPKRRQETHAIASHNGNGGSEEARSRELQPMPAA